MRSLPSSWHFLRRTFDCWNSAEITSEAIFMRIPERRVPRTGSLICPAKIVQTSISTLLVTSSSLAISAFVSKWGASVKVSGFLAYGASIFFKVVSCFLLYTIDSDHCYCLISKCGHLRPLPRHLPFDQFVEWLLLRLRSLLLRYLRN